MEQDPVLVLARLVAVLAEDAVRKLMNFGGQDARLQHIAERNHKRP